MMRHTQLVHFWGRLLAVVTIGLASVSLSVEERPFRSGGGLSTVRTLGNRRGRPRKFSRPAKAVTLTLPEDIIAVLKTIDTDISRAIVRTVEPMVPIEPRPSAELTPFGNRSVIVVKPSRELRERTGVELLPLSDGRALMALADQLSVSQFELRVRDALADAALEHPERETFEALARILRETRQRNGAAIHERSIIVLET
jgi:hypothetical protein